MQKEELKLKVENCLKHSEQILNDSGSLIPMLDIEFVDDKGEKSLIAVALATGEDRDKRDVFIKGLGLTLGAIKRIGKIREVRCVVMMSEAWFSSPSDKNYNSGNYLRPSKDPNRREMLMASGLTADGICIMRSKEMFSVEVKGKRHFTLRDVPELNGDPLKSESAVLENFFWGYNKSMEKNERNDLMDLMAKTGAFKSMSFDEMLQKAIKVLTTQVGGVKSEFINYKK